MPRSALQQNHAEWLLDYFYSVSLLQCLQAITTLTFIKSLSLPMYSVSMDKKFMELYYMNTENLLNYCSWVGEYRH